MRVMLDGRDLLGQPITIRKAPGHANFDYGQTILFAEAQRQHVPTPLSRCAIDQHYVTARLPRVLTVRLDLVSTWGDLHYIGLTGITFHDEHGNLVPSNQIKLYSQQPSSVKDLPGHHQDERTLDKLLDGTNDVWDDGHMWLAPFTTGKAHTIWACFDQEVAISMVQFWNYSKTPQRGVYEFELWFDDLIAFQGRLAPAPARGSTKSFAQPIMFSDAPQLISYACKQQSLCYKSTEQDVITFDGCRLVQGHQGITQGGLQTPRHGIGVSSGSVSRPTTSISKPKR